MPDGFELNDVHSVQLEHLTIDRGFIDLYLEDYSSHGNSHEDKIKSNQITFSLGDIILQINKTNNNTNPI